MGAGCELFSVGDRAAVGDVGPDVAGFEGETKGFRCLAADAANRPPSCSRSPSSLAREFLARVGLLLELGGTGLGVTVGVRAADAEESEGDDTGGLSSLTEMAAVCSTAPEDGDLTNGLAVATGLVDSDDCDGLFLEDSDSALSICGLTSSETGESPESNGELAFSPEEIALSTSSNKDSSSAAPSDSGPSSSICPSRDESTAATANSLLTAVSPVSLSDADIVPTNSTLSLLRDELHIQPQKI